jgi:hypothetical protein
MLNPKGAAKVAPFLSKNVFWQEKKLHFIIDFRREASQTCPK